MLTALLVAGAFFMEFLDGSIIATALPQMGRAFHENPVALNIGITAYLLSMSVFIPLSGWLADRFGPRVIFSIAIAIFTLASLLCGCCQNLSEFTGARILQGFGGAMMVPVGRAVVYKNTAKADLIRVTAYLVWPALVAPILGPPLGGFITTFSSWRWIFFLNVPLGIVAIALTQIWITDGRDNESRPFDWLGFILSASATTTFMYALELIGREQTPWGETTALLLYSVAAGGGAIWWFVTAEHPLIGLKSLSIKTFSISIYGGSLFRTAINAVPFLLPLLFQLVYGLSAFAAGSLVLALFAGNLVMKSVTTPILRRFGFRTTLIVNGVIVALFVAACGLLAPATPKWIILTVLFGNGLVRSMQFTCQATLAFADVPQADVTSASTFMSMVTQLSSALGVAVGAIALRFAAYVNSNSYGVPTMGDFRIAFALLGVIALVGVADACQLPSNAGTVVSGNGG
jgi:EmrB/QacA subfamily drug resistance transporter